MVFDSPSIEKTRKSPPKSSSKIPDIHKSIIQITHMELFKDLSKM